MLSEKFSQVSISDGDKSSRWDTSSDKIPENKGLDSCMYLEYGKCWWFIDKSDEIAPTPGYNLSSSHKDVIRTKRFTSVTKTGDIRNEDEDNTQGANYVFKSKAKYGAYPNSDKNSSEEILHDFVVATPTLEVGVDMDNVTEVITHKAIRNISSYRQKVGRAGLIGSDALGYFG